MTLDLRQTSFLKSAAAAHDLPPDRGAEVAFEVSGFSRDMVVLLQGFIVLFSGAMAYVIAPWLARALFLVTPKAAAVQGKA